VGSNWDIGVSPNNSGDELFDVLIDLETSNPSTVTSGGEEIESLTLDPANATLFELDLNGSGASQDSIDVRRGGQLNINADFTSADFKTIVPRVGSATKISNGAVWDNHGQTTTFGRRADRINFEHATIEMSA